MSVPPPMSIPISKIPIQKSDMSAHEEDPEVLALLNEMQPPPQSKTVAPPQSAISHQHQQQYYNLHTASIQSVKVERPYFDYDIAQKTLYFVVIAFIVFYPNIFDGVYLKMPSLDVYRSHEIIVRAIILFGIVYVILYKFDN